MGSHHRKCGWCARKLDKYEYKRLDGGYYCSNRCMYEAEEAGAVPRRVPTFFETLFGSSSEPSEPREPREPSGPMSLDDQVAAMMALTYVPVVIVISLFWGGWGLFFGLLNGVLSAFFLGAWPDGGRGLFDDASLEERRSRVLVISAALVGFGAVMSLLFVAWIHGVWGEGGSWFDYLGVVVLSSLLVGMVMMWGVQDVQD